MINKSIILNNTNQEGKEFFTRWLTSEQVDNIYLETTGNFFYIEHNSYIYYMPKSKADGCKAGPWGTPGRFATYMKCNKL